jgi:hypothetical protein
MFAASTNLGPAASRAESEDFSNFAFATTFTWPPLFLLIGKK